MCGRFLRQLLAEERRHSTPVGRLLLPVLLGFRILLLAASGPGIFGDDQSEFVCQTQQAGCKAACYDAFHPLSPLRFWAFHVILVAVPSAIYLGFILYHVMGYWEDPGKMQEQDSVVHSSRDSSSPRDASGSRSLKLLWAYVAQVGARVALEGASLGAHYHLYGFKMPISIACRREPCLGSITCNLSRPSEKTIFLKTMFGVSGVCLLFTFLELVLLGVGNCWRTHKHKFPFSKYFSASKSSTRRKDPTGDLPVAEAKEQRREAEL